MSQDIRRELIGQNLGIKPINHGQVHTFQIALPDSKKQTLSLEQRQAIEQSLLAHQSNLISLIIRRTDAYEHEDIEYELVYGADWLQIAQELEIGKVWAWVFDLTDEQAIATTSEMEALTNAFKDPQPTPKTPDRIDSNIADLIDRKLQLTADSIKNLITSLLTGIRNDLDEKLKALNYKIDHNSINSGSGSSELGKVLEQLESIQQQLKSARKRSGMGTEIEVVENPINLLEASDQEIEAALKQINTQDLHIKAAIKAIHHHRQAEQGLTWENLGRSVKAKTNSQDKISGFAKGTYDRLRTIAIIPEQNAEHDSNQDV
jgi:hypothetical protein